MYDDGGGGRTAEEAVPTWFPAEDGSKKQGTGKQD